MTKSEGCAGKKREGEKEKGGLKVLTKVPSREWGDSKICHYNALEKTLVKEPGINLGLHPT